jgi:nucleoside-diphosphate-sugar epimerase|tara:strand:- start:5238 stop:6248 length:1011 start_codon:yes stop_codon:yes gene_type:complete
MKILITGGAGFIGSQIGYNLEKSGNEIILLDNMSYGHADNLSVDGKNIGTFIKKDVRDKDIYKHLEGVDAVIHMAGIAPLPDCQSNPVNALDNNLCGTANMLDASRRMGVKKFIFASTSALYENCKNAPFVENDLEKEPDLIYAISKRQCEILCKSYVSAYGMDVVLLRFFNVYGPHQDFRRKHPPLLGYITKCLLNKTQPTFYSDGEQKRDYVYVDDLIRLVEICLKRNDISGEVFNVASGKAYSVKEIYNIFCNHFDFFIEPRFEKADSFWDKYPQLFSGEYTLSKERVESEVNKYSLGSNEKSHTVLNWKPEVDLDEGIKRVVDYVKKTENTQ